MLELTADTRLDLTSSSLRHGLGLFETLRITRGRPWRLELHLARLAAGCRFLGLDEPPPAMQVLDFLQLSTSCPGLGQGVLRLVAADGRLRVWSEVLDGATPAAASIGRSQETVRYSGNPLNRYKTTSYLENRRLAEEAQRRGLFEVVAPNEQGLLTDGGRTSLFVVRGGRVDTPPVATGALPGIAREALLTAGLVREAPLTWPELVDADALFLANALRGAIPVGELDGHGLRDTSHPLLTEARVLLQGG